MKTRLASLLVILTFALSAAAQSVAYSDTAYFASCYGGTFTPFSLPQLQDYWISPPDTSLPPMIQGHYIEDTLYFVTNDYMTPFGADSLGIDSFYLPAGLCWKTSRPAQQQYSVNDSLIIIVYGTPTAPGGQYFTDMKVHLTSSYTTLNAHVFLSRGSSYRYSMRVACRPDSIVPLHTPYWNFDPDTLYCRQGFPAIAASGPTALCPGNSLVLSAPAGQGFSYHWSTGSTSRTITVATAGTYGLTVTAGGMPYVATPAVITALSSCPPSYWNQVYFQSCNSGVNAVAPVPAAATGLSPSDTDLVCARVGRYVSDTLYFKTLSNLLGTIPVTQMRLDSIYLPTGLCWNSNKVTNTFDSSENGVILIQGITTAPPGQYKLRIIASLWQNTTLLAGFDAESFAGLRYRLKVGCAGSVCPAINGANITDCYIPDSSTCNGTIADISGPASICAGQPVDLHANPGPGYTYQWSTGASAQTISVAAAGSYTVTLYAYGDSAVSHPFVLQAPPQASFSLTQDPTAQHSWIIQNLCTGTALSYRWSWGDGSPADTVPYPAHFYSASGSYPICVHVTDASGCTADFCDSTHYLFKTDDVIQVHVLQYPLGIPAAAVVPVSMAYYQGELHFTPAISAPAAITIYDMSGRRVYDRSDVAGSGLPVSDHIATGIYVAILQVHGSTIAYRFSVVR